MEGLVEITLNGCYTHSDNFEGTLQQAAVLDEAMILLADLQAKGLMDQTLICQRSDPATIAFRRAQTTRQ